MIAIFQDDILNETTNPAEYGLCHIYDLANINMLPSRPCVVFPSQWLGGNQLDLRNASGVEWRSVAVLHFVRTHFLACIFRMRHLSFKWHNISQIEHIYLKLNTYLSNGATISEMEQF
jgi:hypothetical protein